MEFKTEKAFNAAFTGKGRGTAVNAEETTKAGLRFCAEQMKSGNLNPIAVIYVNMSNIARRPKGMNRPNMLKYCDSIGLTFDKKKGTFSKKVKGSNETFDPEWYNQYITVDERTDLQKFQDALDRVAKTARKLEISEEKLAEMLVKAIEEAGKE